MPQATASMRIAREDLRLRRIDVVYPGNDTFALAPGIRAVGFQRLLADIEEL
jgi:hypothetical protein